jgi:hypothetical protein
LNREGEKFCESLSTPEASWHVLREHVRECHNGYYQQFASLEVTESSFTGHDATAHKAEGFGFGFLCWIKGVDLNAEEDLLRNFHLYLGKAATSNTGSGIIRQMLKEIFSAKNLQTAPTLQEPNIWQMTLSERQQLVERWKSEIGKIRVVEKIAELHRRHQEARQYEQRIHTDNSSFQLKNSK